MLKVVKLHNFKTFLNAEVHFHERQLLIGRNCSGKTNLVKALQFLSLAGWQDMRLALNVVPGGIDEVCNWHLKSKELEISCLCDLEFEGDPYEYEYLLRLGLQPATLGFPPSEMALRVVAERLTVHGKDFDRVALLENDGRKAKIFNEHKYLHGKRILAPKTAAPEGATMLSKLHDRSANARALLFRDYLQNWHYYSISPLAIRLGAGHAGSQTEGFGAFDCDGHELSNAIFHLKSFNELRYRRVVEHAQIIEPSLAAIEFFPVPGQSPVPFVRMKGQQTASFRGLSDGTLRALALGLIIELGAMYSPPDWKVPRLAIVEEPENGIAPGQLRRMFDLFEEWAPGVQFIFTSHSPSFIDMFDYQRENVTLLKKAADRTEVLRAEAPAPASAMNGEDKLTLSMEYASELLE